MAVYNENERLIQLEKQFQDNSRRWHETDNEEERAGLHRANEMLSKQIDGIKGGKSSYDPKTGKWTTAYNDGNGNWKNSGVHTSAQFTYNQQKKIDDLTADILGSKFDYNPHTDPSYKAYENMYRREGDRAVKSTLADVASAQGGMSSYAGTAAQQAANYYAQQLTDKIPYLEQLAYEKYGADLNSKYNMLSALQNDKANEYNMWYNDLIRGDNLTQQAYENERYDKEYADNQEYINWQKEMAEKEHGLNVRGQDFSEGTTLYQLAMQKEQQDVENGRIQSQDEYNQKMDAVKLALELRDLGYSVPSDVIAAAGGYLPFGNIAPMQNVETSSRSGSVVKNPGEKTPETVEPDEEEDELTEEEEKAIVDKYNEVIEEYQQGWLTADEKNRRLEQIRLHGVNIKK